MKSKLLTAKKSKTTTYSRVFHPEKSTIFSGNQSWIFGQKMKISNSVLMISCLKRALWYANNFEWIFIAELHYWWNTQLPSSYFSISLKKVSLSFKRSPKNLQLLKGMKIEAALRVKREKQIAHICSDDDAKKCLLINLIMVINCHQIPLLRWVHWASENSKPANVF